SVDRLGIPLLPGGHDRRGEHRGRNLPAGPRGRGSCFCTGPGGGGLYSAVAQGFERAGGAMPRIHAVQPARCSTIVAAYERGDDKIRPSSARPASVAFPCRPISTEAWRSNSCEDAAAHPARIVEADHVHSALEELIYAR